MEVVKSIILTDQQKKEVVRIWNAEYPADLGYSEVGEFENYLSRLNRTFHYLLYINQNTVAAWLAVFTRENERWFAMIVDSAFQKQGLGQKLLHLAKTDEPILNGWVIDTDRYIKPNSQAYLSPLSFYVQNGFRVLPETRLETEVLSAVKIQWRLP